MKQKVSDMINPQEAEPESELIADTSQTEKREQ